MIDGLFAERGNEASVHMPPPPIYAVIARTGSVSSPGAAKHGGNILILDSLIVSVPFMRCSDLH